MKYHQLTLLLLGWVLTLSACGLPSSGTPVSSGPGPVTATETPTSLPSPSVPSLTLDMLKNATYDAPFYTRTVTLVNGTYLEGSPDIYFVQILDVYAFGDLNGDGTDDAAVILLENGGGTGQFESLVAVLNSGGKPLQAGTAKLGDRVRINSVAIVDGEITVDMVVQGPNDAMCCPSQPIAQSYRLDGDNLVMVRSTSRTPDGAGRAINIESPADGAAVTSPVTVTGSETIAPFENTLAYRIYDATNTQINEEPLMVDAPDMGAPGTFTLTFGLSTAGGTGPIRVEILDLSAADGSTLAMDSVMLILR